jgi:predicted kinase
MHLEPTLIVLSGLPGSGKSAVAEVLSSDLSLTVFSKDRLEATLIRSELVQYNNDRLGYSGYELLTECATVMLEARNSVVLDSVCGRESIRSQWRTLASKMKADFLVVECICSDEALHRRRLEDRERNIPGWPELKWDDVLKVRGYFEPWPESHLVIDSVESLEVNRKKLLAFFGNKSV